ncbi:MAG: caspase family protein [Spirochaetes bacterium]|nr:caspase family protein [Spirochaetota bacterium]
MRLIVLTIGFCAALFCAQGDDFKIKRYGIFIGANRGGTLPELMYPVSDARNVAQVFVELGGFNPADVTVCANPTKENVFDEISRLKNTIARNKSANNRIEVFVYYSGHSDQYGLLLGDQVLPYRDLKAAAETMGADMRILILDSCNSGIITTLKGGNMQPSFLVDSSIDMTGFAVLTSSRSSEFSQESDAVGGSFFTHALISGMRGAADTVTDGKVTLNELYQYAYQETLSRTEKTTGGPQHPSFNIRVKGSGDVVLTDTRIFGSRLTLASPVEGRAFIRTENGQLIAEVQKPAGREITIGVPKGDYAVSIERDRKYYQAKVSLADGSSSVIASKDLKPVRAQFGKTKGYDSPSGKSRVGVFAFTGSGVPEADALVATSFLRAELLATGRYDVLDRESMSELLKEQEIQQSGCIEKTCAVEVGRILNMDYMIYGSLVKMNSSVYIIVNQVDVETARVIKIERERIATTDDLDGAMRRLAVRLAGGIVPAAAQPSPAASVSASAPSVMLLLEAGAGAIAGIGGAVRNDYFGAGIAGSFDVEPYTAGAASFTAFLLNANISGVLHTLGRSDIILDFRLKFGLNYLRAGDVNILGYEAVPELCIGAFNIYLIGSCIIPLDRFDPANIALLPQIGIGYRIPLP